MTQIDDLGIQKKFNMKYLANYIHLGDLLWCDIKSQDNFMQRIFLSAR